MFSRLAKLTGRVQKFHANQAGMETIQTVMIIAIAALVLIFLNTQWTDISGWFSQTINSIVSISF